MARNDVDTTLGDINRLDRDNFEHMKEKYGNVYKFSNADAAGMCMAKFIDKIVRKSGVKIRPGMDAKRIDRMLASKNVRIEHRVYGEEEELYRSGVFIYDNKEISGFVSNPFYQVSDIDLLPAFYVLVIAKGVTIANIQ